MNIWNHSSPNGIATNADPVLGGIVDSNIVSGLWFFISNQDDIENQEDFETKAEAIAALEEAVRKLASLRV